MIVQTQVHNLTDPEKEQFEELLLKKLKAIHPIIDAHYPDEDTAKLKVNMNKHDKHTAFECEFILSLPHLAHPLSASEVKHSIPEAMDLALSKLESQVVKHFKKLTRG